MQSFMKNGMLARGSFSPGRISNHTNNGVLSAEVSAAQILWRDMYLDAAPWLATTTKTMSLPSAIASEIAALVTVEMSAKVEGESTRAKFLDDQLEPFREQVQRQTEYACAMGGVVFKPYLNGREIAIDYVQADDFTPLAFNSKGDITACVFYEYSRDTKFVYTRVEKHEIKTDAYYITNTAYRGMYERDLSFPVPLNTVEEWSSLQPETRIENIDFPLYGYFRIPLGNTTDNKSPIGVSVYASAVNLIRDADKQYERLMWEFEGGEMAIDASEDAFVIKNGKPLIPDTHKRLFRFNSIGSGRKGGTINDLMRVFAPNLRDVSLINGLNEILIRIEGKCGLARGTFSNADLQVKTATELRITRQKTYVTVTTIQRALEKSIDALVKAMDAFASLYGLCEAGNYDSVYVWDDSVITDANTEKLLDMQEIDKGAMLLWEYRVKWKGESEEQAKARVKEYYDGESASADGDMRSVAQQYADSFGARENDPPPDGGMDEPEGSNA